MTDVMDDVDQRLQFGGRNRLRVPFFLRFKGFVVVARV